MLIVKIGKKAEQQCAGYDCCCHAAITFAVSIQQNQNKTPSVYILTTSEQLHKEPVIDYSRSHTAIKF